jgi:hypothetical protein
MKLCLIRNKQINIKHKVIKSVSDLFYKVVFDVYLFIPYFIVQHKNVNYTTCLKDIVHRTV